jgi:16S rRNA (cytosine1402-N4)-methyltransferase
VLLRQALEGLAVRDDGWYVDATYGRGGHSAEILARLGPQGKLLALDKDPDAVAHAESELGADPRCAIRHAGFEDLRLVALPWLGGRKLDGVLFDLGVSSPQLDQPSRGFSFAHDGPLDMRMNTASGATAA